MAIKIIRKEPQQVEAPKPKPASGPRKLNEHDLCPKCRARAWYEVDGTDIVQRCTCGMHRYVWQRTINGGYRTHVQRKEEFRMPEKGTKLSKCLGFVAAQYPNTVTTADLCGVSGQNTSDVSSQLIVLMHKGLVDRVEARPGTKGGSIWRVTRRALEALSMEV
jgi:Zn ribbon nucleic-acid-binding protein